MKQTITQTSKRWLSLLLAVIMTATMIPLSAISAFAFSTSSGQTVDSAYGTAYIVPHITSTYTIAKET